MIKIRRLFNDIGNVILTILVLLLIGYGFAFFELKIMLKDHPELFGHTFVLIHDNKMVSDFYKDDIAIVKKDAEYNIGDRVLILSSKKGYVLSTVIASDSVSTTTQCNTCSKPEAPVDNSQVIGKAVAKIRYLGKLIRFFKKKIVLFILALLGIGCIVASRFAAYKPNVRKKKVKKENKENNEVQS